MAKSKITVKLLESNRNIVAKINKALAEMTDKEVRRRVARIKSALQPIIAAALFDCPEIISLASGVLCSISLLQLIIDVVIHRI